MQRARPGTSQCTRCEFSAQFRRRQGQQRPAGFQAGRRDHLHLARRESLLKRRQRGSARARRHTFIHLHARHRRAAPREFLLQQLPSVAFP